MSSHQQDMEIQPFAILNSILHQQNIIILLLYKISIYSQLSFINNDYAAMFKGWKTKL